MAEANINFEGSFNGTVTGPVSDEALLRAMGGGRRAAAPPPAEPSPPPPVNEDPPFVVRNRQASDTEVRTRHDHDEEVGDKHSNAVWIAMGTIVGLVLIVGVIIWLSTRFPEVPVDEDGRIPVVIVQKNGDEEARSDNRRPVIVNNGAGAEVDVTIEGDKVVVKAKNASPVLAPSPTRAVTRSSPSAATPTSRCMCPRDSLSNK